ncbi:MAG: IS4 family transposase [Ignavibacteria bacterium]|nr:IS4 family transposase [Ignavibacteria bacterium]
MNSGKTIFSQLINYIPKTHFDRMVLKYKGNRRLRTFSCWDQYLSMAFAQLTYRESLRDIQACLRSNRNKLYHMGIKGNISRTNLSRANEIKDYRIYESLALKLIEHAQTLFDKNDMAYKELNNALYALDSTVIDLSLTLFPWAQHRQNKSAIRINTLLDVRTLLPAFINISSGGVHEINSLDLINVEPMAIYIMDKGFMDFERFNRLNSLNAYFIIRAKRNQSYKRIYSLPTSGQESVISDQVIKMTGPKTSLYYPHKLRRIRYYDMQNNRYLIFITNNLNLNSNTIAALYKERWKIELFFRWIKQNSKIKSFYGRSQNAIKTQIWIAISVYAIVVIMKKELMLKENIYTILQVLSVNIFSKLLLNELFTKTTPGNMVDTENKQLFLFNF